MKPTRYSTFLLLVCLAGCTAAPPTPDQEARRQLQETVRRQRAEQIRQLEADVAAASADLEKFRQEKQIATVAETLPAERERLGELSRVAADAKLVSDVALAAAAKAQGWRNGGEGTPDLTGAEDGDAQMRDLLATKLQLEIDRTVAVHGDLQQKIKALDEQLAGVEKKLVERKATLENEALDRLVTKAQEIAKVAGQRYAAALKERDTQAAHVGQMEDLLDEEQERADELAQLKGQLASLQPQRK